MDDLISRQAAYDTLTEYYNLRTETQRESLKEALSRVPTAQPEWEELLVICDVCGHAIRVKRN